MTRTAYFDTSIFVEMGARKSAYGKLIRDLLKDLTDSKIRIYTSIITVQEVAVASYRSGTVARDTYGDINSIARIYGVTKEVALTAAKIEAELRDITQKELERRDSNKSETEEQRLERICENRRRKWDCFHIATAQKIGCTELYSTDENLHKRPAQLGIKNLRVLAPGESVKSISGPLFEKVKDVTEIKKN